MSDTKKTTENSAEKDTSIPSQIEDENYSSLLTKKANYSGTLSLGDIELNCFVTGDGERFISGRSMTGAIGMKGRGQGMARISTNSTLKPFMSNDLIVAIENPVRIIGKTPKPVHGYRAEILADLCDALLEARKEKALITEQEIRYGQYAELLVRGFARVGIVALVDEATGYQEIRAKDALQAILDKYLRKEFAAWAKRFPDDFYREIFRLREWNWNAISAARPRVVGRYTNDIVYARLAPGILDELRSLNPKQEDKGRARKHHQYLTDDIGHPALAQHLHAVIGLMRASSTWGQFKTMLDRAFPKKGTQLDLLLNENP